MSVVIGENGSAEGRFSEACGYMCIATGYASMSRGSFCVAYGNYSNANGDNCEADGEGSHAEGIGAMATAKGAHAEGRYTYATGYASHAEGDSTTAAGDYSHAEGNGAVTAETGDGLLASNPHHRAWAWNGVSGDTRYHSHGAGTFNINPVPASGSNDPATGFYIGEKTLATIIAEAVAAALANQ